MPDDRDSIAAWLEAIHNAIKEHSEDEAKYQQSEASQRLQQAQTESKTVVRFPPEITEYYASEQRDRLVKNRNETIRLWMEGLGLIAAVALVIVTLCTLRTFNGQLVAMQQANADAKTAAQNQIDAINKQMRLEQRCWLSTGLTTTIQLIDRQPLVVPIALRNSGKTPAVITRGFAVINVLKRGDEPDFRYRTKRHDRVVYEISHAVIPPDSGITVTYPATHKVAPVSEPIAPIIVDDTLRQQIAEGDVYLVVYGRIFYDDVFGGHHWITFCADSDQIKITPQIHNTVTNAKCQAYNNADRND